MDQLALDFAGQVPDGTSKLLQGEITKNTDQTFKPEISFRDKDGNARESTLSPDELMQFQSCAVLMLTAEQAASMNIDVEEEAPKARSKAPLRTESADTAE